MEFNSGFKGLIVTDGMIICVFVMYKIHYLFQEVDWSATFALIRSITKKNV